MTQEFYICECCGETFEKGWTDEEMIDETTRNFPDLDDEHAAIVCDDCYEKIFNYINNMPELKISFGNDQYYIDELVKEMVNEGKVIVEKRSVTNNHINYILVFSTEMNIYEFGYRQGTFLRERM